MPADLIVNENDTSRLASLLESHYRDNWIETECLLKKEIGDLGVDEESHALFVEALTAHKQGLYRLVGRGLFPDIERVTRLHFSIRPFQNMACVKELRASAGELFIGPHTFFQLFEKLDRHIYEDIRDQAALDRAVASSVPNRHAAIHGYAAYSNFSNSMNSIFLALYVYAVLKELRDGI